MYYSTIKYCDIANGPGVRTSLFVSGCRRNCKGCFNPEAQHFSAGEPFSAEVEAEILASLEPGYIAGLSVLGGEPMEPENQESLAPFLLQVKDRFPRKPIWLYTGYLLEDLLDKKHEKHTEYTLDLFHLLDVVVDGPFLEEKKDISLRFRGSSNQRIIDIPRTFSAHCVTLVDDL